MEAHVLRSKPLHVLMSPTEMSLVWKNSDANATVGKFGKRFQVLMCSQVQYHFFSTFILPSKTSLGLKNVVHT